MTKQNVEVARLRHDLHLVSLLSTIIALALALATGLGWNLDGYGVVAIIAAFLTILPYLMTGPAWLNAIGDTLKIAGVLMWTAFSCGAIAVMSVRSAAPIADGWLNAADQAISLPATRIIEATSHAPRLFLEVLAFCYQSSGLWLIASLVVLPLIGQSARAWKLGLMWASSLLSVSLIAFVAPARGSFTFIGAEVSRRLPEGAGRFAFDAFDRVRFAEAPVLSTDLIGAVITFPSFHTICALLIAQSWSGFRFVAPVAVSYAAVTIFSTLPIGGHYSVDVVAGALVWWACARIVDRDSGWSTASALMAAGRVLRWRRVGSV